MIALGNGLKNAGNSLGKGVQRGLEGVGSSTLPMLQTRWVAASERTPWRQDIPWFV
jgi:hypothetical protein